MAVETNDASEAAGINMSFSVGAAPTVAQIVGTRQGLLMDALLAFNEAVDAARVLEPHVERVKLVLDFLDETPRCEACGQPH